MKPLTRRRIRNLVVTIVLAMTLLAFDVVYSATLSSTALLTGWLLLALIVFLTLYNIRKQAPFLPRMPFASSAAWLQCHIYAGLLTFVLFLVHLRYSLPQGILDCTLAAAYLSVFLSGLAGLAMSRRFAPRLTTAGQEVLFERIPVVLRGIRQRVETLVLKSREQPGASAAIANFYGERLKAFFERPRHFGRHVFDSQRPCRTLILELQTLRRYIDETERQILDRIEQQVRIKNDLDRQYALQACLKYWLFIHVPLTYVLLMFSLLHLVLVYAY